MQKENGEPKQTRSKTGKYKCDVCDDEFGRKYEWRQHFVTDRHLKQVALGTDEEALPKTRPFACMKGGCIECYGRKDEVLRHVRRKHPEIKLPPKRVQACKGKRGASKLYMCHFCAIPSLRCTPHAALLSIAHSLTFLRPMTSYGPFSFPLELM